MNIIEVFNEAIYKYYLWEIEKGIFMGYLLHQQRQIEYGKPIWGISHG